jgi:hypothetical protein
MGMFLMYEIQDGMPAHARATITEPREGWTRPFYECHIAQYAIDRGAAPRTVTLHPETMASLGFGVSWMNDTETAKPGDPLLISLADHARNVITLYE